MNLQKSSKLKTNLYKANRAQKDMIKIFGKYQKRDHRISIKDFTQKDLDQLYQDSCSIGINLMLPIEHVGSIKNPTIYIPNKQFKKAHIFKYNRVINIAHSEHKNIQNIDIKLKAIKAKGKSRKAKCKAINQLPKDQGIRNLYVYLIYRIIYMKYKALIIGNKSSRNAHKRELLKIGYYCEVLYNYRKSVSPRKFIYPISDILDHYHIRTIKSIQQLLAIQAKNFLHQKKLIPINLYNREICKYNNLFKILSKYPKNIALVVQRDKNSHIISVHMVTAIQFIYIIDYAVKRLKRKKFVI